MGFQGIKYTSVDEIRDVYSQLSQTFKSGVTWPLPYRRRQLLQLARLVQDNITSIEDAYIADLGKPRQECTAVELVPLVQSCLYAAEHLEEWSQPERPKLEEWRSSWDAAICHVPKGLGLIIAPWNCPFYLSLSPLIGAIAAGCVAAVKPSEHAPHSAALLASLLPKYLDPSAYKVVLGATNEVTALLELRWDHIVFTGTTKNPVVIDSDCDVELAAKRALFGKCLNAGQICVLPDYVLVPRSVAGPFKEALKQAYKSFFPKGPLHPDANWWKIVNPSHFTRLKDLMDRTRGNVLVGGEVEGTSKIAPTVYIDVKLDDALLEGEIFGPLLAIVEVEGIDEAIEILANRPSPLVVYLFTNRVHELKEKFFMQTSSGTLTVNDTFMQLTVPDVPFGGKGDSGYGSYPRKEGYDAFTQRRGYVNIPFSAEPFFGARYLPYTDEKYKIATADVHTKIPEC